MKFDRTYLRLLMPEQLVMHSNATPERSELEIVLTEHLEDALEGRSLALTELKNRVAELEDQLAALEKEHI